MVGHEQFSLHYRVRQYPPRGVQPDANSPARRIESSLRAHSMVRVPRAEDCDPAEHRTAPHLCFLLLPASHADLSTPLRVVNRRVVAFVASNSYPQLFFLQKITRRAQVWYADHASKFSFYLLPMRRDFS